MLAHIVREYISSSTPVSSRSVTELMNRSFSSATIRNIMGRLEDEGFLRQPHTSAGRIPTEKAYRFYVNRIRDVVKLKEDETRRICTEYSYDLRTLEEIIERTSRFISRELRKASIVMWPCMEDTHLKHIAFLKLGGRSILAIIVTMTNAVKHYVLDFDKEHGTQSLEQAANYLNRNYRGASFMQISDNLNHTKEDAARRGHKQVQVLASMAEEIVEGILKKNLENEIYWEGLDYFMEEGSLDDLDTARRLIRAITQRRDLVRLLRKDLSSKGMRAYIGEECGQNLSGLSIITCGYSIRGRMAGRLGVIGPTKMDYERVLGTVRFLTELLSSKLNEMKKQR